MSTGPINGAGQPTQIPPSFRFAANPRTTQDASAWKTIIADGAPGYVYAGQQLQWVFSSDGFIDPASISIETTVEILNSSQTVIASSDRARVTAPGPWTMIQQIDTFGGNDEISSSREYDTFHTMMYLYNMDDVSYDQHSYLSAADAYPFFGVYTNSNRDNLPGLKTGDQVSILPLIGLTAQTQAIPLPFLKNVGLVVRLTLRSAANCLFIPAGSSAVSYRWKNPILRYRVSYPNANLFAQAQAAWVQGLYALDINSYDHFPYQGKVDAGTDVIVVTDQASNVQCMFWVIRETLRQQYDPLRNRRFLSLMHGTTGSQNITTGQYQVEINGTLFPERPVIWNRYYTMEVYLHAADAFKSLKAVPNQMMNVWNDRKAKERTFSLLDVDDNYRSGLIDSTVMGIRFDAFTTMESNTILSGPDTKSVR